MHRTIAAAAAVFLLLGVAACGTSNDCSATDTCAAAGSGDGASPDGSAESDAANDGPGSDGTVPTDALAPGDGSSDAPTRTDASDASAPMCGSLGQSCCAMASCSGGFSCVASVCTCPSGSKLCNAACIPSSSCCQSSDCTGGETCTGGTCACTSGESLCMGTCVSSSEACCSNSDCGVGGLCTAGVCSCQTGYRSCASGCIPSSDCCTNNDCSASSTNTCSGGTCTCNGSIACVSPEVCSGSGCGCPSGTKLCDDACIPSSECCTSNDCAGVTTNTCTNGTCTCNGGSACTGGQQCTTSGGCACPPGELSCSGVCVVGNCCANADCASPPNVCYGTPGTCSDGVCEYAPTPPSAPAPNSCDPPGNGTTLNGFATDGLCSVSIYYCSATGTPIPQTPPAGYVDAPSNPVGCQSNTCGLNGLPATTCQENFCADAMGNCSTCLQ